jgi:hypothetical protein
VKYIRRLEMRQALELVGGSTADQWGMVTSRQVSGAGVDLHEFQVIR